MRTALALVVVSLIGLLYFNPDMEDFRLFVEAQSDEIIQRELGGGTLGRLLGGVGSRVAADLVDDVTVRRNYFVFSTYTIDLDGEPDDEEWRFLGIAARFVVLERPASMSEEAGSP